MVLIFALILMTFGRHFTFCSFTVLQLSMVGLSTSVRWQMIKSHIWNMFYCSLQQWKNFANPPRIDKVIAMVRMAPFLTHSVVLFWNTMYNTMFMCRCVYVCVCPAVWDAVRFSQWSTARLAAARQQEAQWWVVMGRYHNLEDWVQYPCKCMHNDTVRLVKRKWKVVLIVVPNSVWVWLVLCVLMTRDCQCVDNFSLYVSWWLSLCVYLGLESLCVSDLSLWVCW